MVTTAQEVVRDGSLGLQQQQQIFASGRPGPNVQSGSLRRGIQTIDVHATSAYAFEGGTKATVIYSRIQEEGGDIYPKRGAFLSWQGTRADGTFGWIRKRHVHIPARPYMRPGVKAYQPKYRELAESRFSRAILGG